MELNVFLIPIILQALVMFVDEFYFHHKRGLGKFERLGHPIDTISFLTVLISLKPFAADGNSTFEPTIFFAACVLSCLIVTKDEWIHTAESSGTENWLHSLLFILHPVVLYCFYKIHELGQFQILQFQLVVTLLFFTYQLLWWNLFWKNKKYPKQMN